MFSLFTIPDASSTIASIGDYSSPWFTELLPVVYISVGLFLGVGFIIFLISIFLGVIGRIFGGGQEDIILTDKGYFSGGKKMTGWDMKNNRPY